MSYTSFPGEREIAGSGSSLQDSGVQPMAAGVAAPRRTPSGAHRAARPLRGTLHEESASRDRGRTVSRLWRVTLAAILVPTLGLAVGRALRQWPHAATAARTIVSDVVTRPGQTLAGPIGAIAGSFAGAPESLTHASITLRSDPPSEVWIDGKRIGKTPVVDLVIDIGAHEVRFHNERFDRVHEVVATRSQPIVISVDAEHP
jgi:hypothetical protein